MRAFEMVVKAKRVRDSEATEGVKPRPTLSHYYSRHFLSILSCVYALSMQEGIESKMIAQNGRKLFANSARPMWAVRELLMISSDA